MRHSSRSGRRKFSLRWASHPMRGPRNTTKQGAAAAAWAMLYALEELCPSLHAAHRFTRFSSLRWVAYMQPFFRFGHRASSLRRAAFNGTPHSKVRRPQRRPCRMCRRILGANARLRRERGRVFRRKALNTSGGDGGGCCTTLGSCGNAYCSTAGCCQSSTPEESNWWACCYCATPSKGCWWAVLL